MAKAKKVTLISFTLPNKVGQLAAVTELIAGAKLDVQGFQAVEAGASAEFRLAVKNTAKAVKALGPLGVQTKEESALRVQMVNKRGRLQRVARKLADAGVNVRSSWATAFAGKTATCIFLTSDDAKAIAALAK
ncbi:MAG: hypothetical protein ACLQCB_02935 [Spirochaetia bacterium]